MMAETPIREVPIKSTPVRVIAKLLAITFVTEVGIMFLLTAFLSTRLSVLVTAGIDAFLLVLVLSPILWWVIVRPLERGHEESESRLSDLVAGQARILESFFKHTQASLAFLDRNFNFIRVNDAYAKACRHDASEFAGRSYFELCPSDGLRPEFQRVVQTRELFEVFGRPFVFPDQEEAGVTYWDLTLAPIQDDRGEVEFLVLSLNDVTERRRAEEQRERLVALIEASPDFIGFADPKTTQLQYINRRGRRMCGIGEDENVGNLTIGDVHPAWMNKRLAEVILPAAVRDGVWEGEAAFLHRDGHEIPVSMVLLARKAANGDVDIFYTVSRDITERRKAEESLRLEGAALYAAADAIVITDRAGTVEWVNPAFSQLTGYTAEEVLGKNPRDLVKSGKHDQAFFKDLWETILAGRPWHGQMINRRKDGSLYTEDQTVTPIVNASGAITHFIAIKEDISERFQLEAQFRQAQKMDSVGQLASGIAHDFNNLLTVINGTAELVLAQVSRDDPVHADVQEISRAGERAATLTRQLLAFSRQQILEPCVLSFNTVVAGMEGLLRRLLGEDIDLVIAAKADVGLVKADPGQLEQVITNLVVNARDAMPKGGRLTIETGDVEIDEANARTHGVAVPTGSYARLTVSDSGVGMDEATQSRIFDPFFTTKAPGKGTGLGLSTVYGIVKQSHGFIWVYSEVGQGTSFTIHLPQVVETAGPVRAEPNAVSSSGTEAILLVEDDTGLRKLATRVLKPAGYTVLEAATGEEALAVLEGHCAPVHLLLTDVVMPGMSGRELAERFAGTHPAMKALYMSGYTDDTIVRHGVLDAQSPFLHKPFTAASLLRKVREVLDSQ